MVQIPDGLGGLAALGGEETEALVRKRAGRSQLLGAFETGLGVIRAVHAQELVSETKPGFDGGDRPRAEALGRGEIGAHHEAKGLEGAAGQVRAELVVHRRKRGVEGGYKGVGGRPSLAEQGGEFAEPGLVVRVVAQHEIVGQQPGFGVEDSPGARFR